jgi:hypothetical protein
MDPLFQPLLHGLDILREFIDPRLAKWANAQVLPNRVLFQLAHHKKFDGMVVNPITNLPAFIRSGASPMNSCIPNAKRFKRWRRNPAPRKFAFE